MSSSFHKEEPPSEGGLRVQMKTKLIEYECPECNGTGFPKVPQPVQPGRKIYPAPCKNCGGKGRITEAAQLRPAQCINSLRC